MNTTEWDPRDKEQEFYRESYLRTRDPAFLYSALHQCHKSAIPPPYWLFAYIAEALEPLRHKRGTRTRSFVEREHQTEIDFERAYKIHQLRKAGVTVREVYQAAADELASTPSAGSDEAMRQSWNRVKRFLPPV